MEALSASREHRKTEAPIPGTPEFFRDIIQQNPIYLVSADMPGSGSTTFVQGMIERLSDQHNEAPFSIHVGQTLRDIMGIYDRDQLQERITQTEDPQVLDQTIYADLPNDRPCIINGELATTLGPQYTEPDRPIICIDLKARPVIAAKRVLEREGNAIADIFRDTPPIILGQLALTSVRMEAARKARGQAEENVEPDTSNVFRFTADTNKFSAEELVERFSGNGDFSKYVPEWEHQSLQDTIATLADLRSKLGDKVHRIDVMHFNYQLEAIRYNAERLRVVLHPEAIAEVRDVLQRAITDCWFSLAIKEIPRFFADQNGETKLDTESGAWTPNYYKIAEAWPVLNTLLKDKDILDPFAGAGTLINLLVAHGVPSSALTSDIAYNGGVPLNDAGDTYLPELNGQASRLVFDSLPSWYRPKSDALKGCVTADARQLPFKDNAIDYIVGDPPYGRRHPTGGLDLLLTMLDEFSRVSREGSIFLLPADWPDQIRAAGYGVEQLTNEVSRGMSNNPVCYIRVTGQGTNNDHVT